MKLWRYACLLVLFTILLYGCGQNKEPTAVVQEDDKTVQEQVMPEGKKEKQEQILAKAAKADDQGQCEYPFHASIVVNGDIDRAVPGEQQYQRMKDIQEPLAEIHSISFYDMKMTSTAFMDQFSNVTVLDISNCTVPDTAFLEGFTGLTKLKLSSCHISDIGFLAQLENLEELYLDGNQIADISVFDQIKNKTKLKKCTLNYNQITDIEPLSGFTSITYLGLMGNDLETIEPVRNMEELEEIFLLDGNHSVTDLAPLYELPNLKTVMLCSFYQLSEEEQAYFEKKGVHIEVD